MMKKTLIATATAGLIAAGAMVGTTSTASAASIYFGGPGWSVGVGGPGWGPQRLHKVCKPVFKTVRWHDRWGRLHINKVVVRQTCHWTHRNHRQDGVWQRGPNPRWGWGY